MTAADYPPTVVQGLMLGVSASREQNVQLVAGQVSEAITVTSTATEVELIGAEVAGVVTGEQVRLRRHATLPRRRVAASLLGPRERRRLSRLARDAERLFGAPQDIEKGIGVWSSCSVRSVLGTSS